MSACGTQINHVINIFDKERVVFNHDNGMPSIDELTEGLQQLSNIVEMQSCCWFIKEK